MHIDLPEDLQAIIDDMAERFDITPEEALEYALRDWAITQGILKPDDELTEDTPTEGNA